MLRRRLRLSLTVSAAAAANRRPILVTGSHRSGTTWVGRMLEAAGDVYYVHEPFNPVFVRPGLCDAPFRGFTYVHAGNAHRFDGALSDVIEGRYHVGRGLLSVRSKLDLKRMLGEARRAADARRTGKRTLVKDPIALLSSEWLADRFGMDVVVMVRHPAAFVASIKRVGWRHDLQAFLDEPALMDDLLDDQRDLLERSVARGAALGVVEEAAVVWVLLHEAIRRFRERRPSWAFVRHEELSSAPLEGYADLYARLGLALTPQARATIAEHSDSANPLTAREGEAHELRRNSTEVVRAWTRQLDPAEIDLVRGITGELAAAFYDDADWAAV